MALAENTQVAASRNPFVAFVEGIFTFLTSISDTNKRIREVEYLQEKSDAELAKMGLKREDIARFVFRDMMYL